MEPLMWRGGKTPVVLSGCYARDRGCGQVSLAGGEGDGWTWTKKNSAEMTRVSLEVYLIRDQSSTQHTPPGSWVSAANSQSFHIPHIHDALNFEGDLHGRHNPDFLRDKCVVSTCHTTRDRAFGAGTALARLPE